MKIAVRTHTGLIRQNNEDSFLIRDPYLLVVADGMGGEAAGEIASRGTLKAFEAATHSLRHRGEKNALEVLVSAFMKANSHVFNMAEKNQEYAGMGTTLTAVYFPDNQQGYCCHVGDSRLYLYHAGELRQLTEDHTFVAELVRKGIISHEEALQHPKRHMLVKAVGVYEDVLVDSFQFLVAPGDIVLLCSDGLSDMVKDMELEELIRQEHDVEKIADSLLEAALNNGGRDNITLLVGMMEEEEVAE